MAGDIVLSVKNVSKCFEMYDKPVHRLYQTLCAGKKRFYREFWALKDISFEVRKGECVGIIGRNGAGKSTLLQIITGTLAPTTGEVKLKGRVAALLELGSGFNPEFTGRENVYLNGSILGLTREEIDARYAEILAFADIGEFIDQPVKTYSSGMMVRLAFAVQVMVEPDILIVDEALAVGDALFQRKCYARMDDLVRKGTTLFLVTHSLGEVKRICKKAVYLKSGKISAIGDAVEVAERYMQDLFPTAHEVSLLEEQPHAGTDDVGVKNRDEACLMWNRRDDSKAGSSYGSGEGEVTSVRVYGFKRNNIMPYSGKVRIEVSASWDSARVMEAIAKGGLRRNVYMGYSVATQNNVQLFGANTYTQGVMIDPAEKSQFNAVFEVDWPTLVMGNYFLSAALSIGIPTASSQLKWTDFAIQLVSENDIRGGVLYPKTVILKG